MRTKVTLLLVFLNVALFFFIFKVERDWKTERALTEQRSRVLGAEASNLQTIRISGPARPGTVELTRRAEGWYVTAPFEWPANRFAVDRVATELERLEHETSFNVRDLAKTNQTLADYGLAQPRLSVTFASGDPASRGTLPAQTLRIGDKTKDGNRLFVLSPDGERIHVVGNSLAESLLRPVEELRSDVIFSIPVFEVKSLILKTAVIPSPSSIRIERDESNRWNIKAPIQTRANTDATTLALTGLTGLRVKGFPEPAPADAISATNPTLQLTLEGRNRSEKLVVGNRVAASPSSAGGTEYYATIVSTKGGKEDNGTVFTVMIPAALKDQLDNPLEKLRDRHLLPDFDPRAATAVTLRGPGGELTLQRLEASSPPVWQSVRRDAAPAQPARTADPDVVQRLLTRIAELEATEFGKDTPSRADLESWGLTNPERILTLAMAGAAAPSVLELGVGTDRKVRAQVRGTPYVYDVREDILPATAPVAADYRDRRLRDLPSGARITAVRLTDTASKAVLLDWSQAGDAPPPATSPVAALLPQLQSLRAQEFVDVEFGSNVRIDDMNRPWRYQLDLTIALAAGVAATQTSTNTLWFSERVGGERQYAGSKDLDAVWIVPTPLRDQLWRLISAPTDPGAPAGAGN